MTPLAKWLRAQGISQEAFAAMVSAAAGWRICQSNVSKWATGKQRPHPAARQAIERATLGKVKVEVWQ